MVFKVSSLIVILAGIATPGFAQFGVECFAATDVEFDCSSFITTFCNTISTTPIASFDTMARCFDLPTTHCDFTVVTPTDATITPDFLTCVMALTLVSENCPQGGAGQFTESNADIYSIFWMDPNNGVCSHPEIS
ncbi:hypothetical protein B0H12DRAFT_1244151 [Mycena haematopus]|nr:hypothetical protein B0H12DRAFT_1244151 [Mycena haematopus]